MRVCHAPRLGGLLAVLASLWAIPAVGAPAAITHLQVQGRLVEQLTAQLLPPLERVQRGAVLSLRDTGEHALTQVLADSIAARLTRGGIEVWIAPGNASALDSTSAEGWVLELGVDDAQFAVGPPTKGLLVLGGGRSRRQASARVAAALLPAPHDPPVWSGAPSAVYTDSFGADEATAVGVGMPAWMTTALTNAPKDPPAKSGWIERVAVVGLIGGVVLIYAAGAN